MRNRMLIVVYNNIFDNAIYDILDKMNVCGFTEINDVKGRGCQTGFHLGTPVYPDLNNMLFIIEEDEKIRELAGKLKAMNEEFPEEGIKLFTVPVEEI